MDQGWDRDGAAAAALHRVVQDFGQQVLTRADMLEGLLLDDLSGLPREVDVLTSAARTGVSRLLAERIGHGVSAEAAVDMAANDMTSRTAVDPSGARWAAAEFARVLGYPVAKASPPPTQVARQPTALAQPHQAPGQPAVLPGQAQPAARPAQPQPAAFPVQTQTAAFPGQAQPGAFPAQAQPAATPPGYGQAWARSAAVAARVQPAAPSNGLAIGAGVLTGILALLALTGSAFALPLYFVDFPAGSVWPSRLLLAAGFATAGIWAIARRQTGDGFAATIGLALPVSFGAFDTIANFLIGKSAYGGYGYAFDAATWLALAGWLVLGLAAAVVGIVGVARARQSWRVQPGPLRVILVVLAVGFALANVAPQASGSRLVLGSYGWFFVPGILYLILLTVPPLLATFLPCGHGAKMALWCGWLIFTLAWQVSDIPANGYSASYGLYLTWLVWIATLAATIAMAVRRPVTPAARS